MRDNSYSNDHLRGYVPSLDGLRAIAILIVIVAHGSFSTARFLYGLGFQIDLSSVHGIGLVGVQIFFCLSGFIITTKLIEEYHDTRTISIYNFYVRRTFRIIPASTVFLIAIAGLSYTGQIDVAVSRILSAFLLFANYSNAPSSWYVGHFWSLAVEEHFYLIWPALFAILMVPRRIIPFLIIVIVSIGLWRALDFKFAITGSPPAYFWGRTDIQADNIAFGVLAAVIMAKFGVANLAQYNKRWIFYTALSVVVGSYFVSFGDWKLTFLLLEVRSCAIAIVIALAVIGGLKKEYWVLEWKPLRYIGSISYSLYLWQQIFLTDKEASVAWLANCQRLPLNFALALLLAIASKTFVERPMIKLGKYFLKSTKLTPEKYVAVP